MFNKKIVIITLIGIMGFSSVAGGYYYFKIYKKSNLQTTIGQDVYYTVGTGDITNNIKILGETNLLQEQKLKFNIDGEIKTVNVTLGQKVKQGDLLASLNKNELENELKQANITYENAKVALDNLLSKTLDEDKLKDKTSLDDKKRKIDNGTYDLQKLKSDNEDKVSDKQKEINDLKDGLEKLKIDNQISSGSLLDNLSDKKVELDYKTSTLENDKWKINQSIADEKKNLTKKITDYNRSLTDTYNQIDNDLVSIEDNLKTFNQALRIDKDIQDLEDNIYYSAKNTTYKNKASQSYWLAKSNYLKLQSKLQSLKIDSLTIDDLTGVLSFEKTVYQNLYDTAINVSAGAEYSVETENFTSGDISSIKSSSNSIKTSSNSSKTSIDDTISKLKDAEGVDLLTKKSNLEIEKLTKDLQDLDTTYFKLQKEYNDLLIQIPTKLKDLQDSLLDKTQSIKTAQKSLAEIIYANNIAYEDKEIELKNLKNDYDIDLKNFSKKYGNIKESQEVVLANNTLKQAEIGIDQVNKKILNYELRAPFDGTIENINFKVGDKLSSSNSTDEKFVNIVNPGLIEVKIKLDQIDVIKVSKGLQVNVGFDSYPDKVFTGVLNDINSKPIDDNGTKKYEAKVVIDKGDLNIFSGMSANVEIVFESKQNVILVPTMSIETDSNTGNSFVTILKNQKKTKQTIELGLNADGNTEVLSGLEVGDQVLEINFDENKFKVEDFNSPTPYYGG